MQPRVDLTKYISSGPGRALLSLSKEVAHAVDPTLMHLVEIRASQINHCAYCIDMHTKDARLAGETEQRIYALSAWREAPFFSERERAGLELAEAFVFIHEDGVPDDVYDRVGGILSEKEYVALSWILVSINAFNRIAIAGRYDVPPRDDLAPEDADAAAGTAW